MNTAKITCLVLLQGCLTLPLAQAQFDSGSTGAHGALHVTNNLTLDLPADGLLHFTTMLVESNTTLTFNRNPLNTPVHLLATSNVTIHGTIDVSGKDGTSNPPAGGLGGPGGYKGGEPGTQDGSIPPGAGEGPGAGRGQNGTTATSRAGAAGHAFAGNVGSTTNNGGTYGTPLVIPMLGGSGGGGRIGQGGGGGGGALLIASGTRIDVTGSVLAQPGSGGFNQGNDGSGGAIRLVAPVVAGDGTLNVRSAWGGHGRLRVDAMDRSGVAFDFQPAGSATLGRVMMAIPNPLPRLDLLEVAGTNIVAGTPMPVSIVLPFGSDPNQSVTVQATDFNAQVPIQVVLTPEHGPPTRVEGMIDNTAANPAQAILNVTFPTNAPTAVQVFTRSLGVSP